MSGMRTSVHASAVLCLGLLVGCATADPNAGDDDVTVTIDAPGGNVDAPIDAPPPIDAPIDAPAPQMITLTQSTSTAITPQNTVSCNNGAAGNFVTAENSYYRVFHLPSSGINAPFTVQRIDFAIEEALAGTGGSQTVQARAYTLAGAFTTANLTPIAGNTVTVTNQSLTMMSVTMSPSGIAPAGSTLVIEIFVPDAELLGHRFFLGSNTASETGPGYLRAPECGANQPTPIDSLVGGITPPPVVRPIMTVTGTY